MMPTVSHDVQATTYAASRDWLEGLPEALRNVTAQWAHKAARAGASEPVAVLLGLALTVGEHRYWGSSDRERLAPIAEALARDTAGALAYCAWVLRLEGLPPAERERLTAERGRPYREAAMTAQAPTERQISYLHGLGYRGPAPESKAAASALIDLLRAERAT